MRKGLPPSAKTRTPQASSTPPGQVPILSANHAGEPWLIGHAWDAKRWQWLYEISQGERVIAKVHSYAAALTLCVEHNRALIRHLQLTEQLGNPHKEHICLEHPSSHSKYYGCYACKLGWPSELDSEQGGGACVEEEKATL